MNSQQLRALIGASDSLRAAFLATDDPILRARIQQVAAQVALLIGHAVKGQVIDAPASEVVS